MTVQQAMAAELSWRSKPEDFTTKYLLGDDDSTDKRASFFGYTVTPARNTLTNGGKLHHLLNDWPKKRKLQVRMLFTCRDLFPTSHLIGYKSYPLKIQANRISNRKTKSSCFPWTACLGTVNRSALTARYSKEKVHDVIRICDFLHIG